MIKQPYKFIGIKFSEADARLVKEVATDRGENVSSFIRLAVRKELARLSFFTDLEKRALGIKPDGININVEGDHESIKF